MKFEQESWRKLYVRESVEHRMMSLFARGLRDYLLRHTEPDGTVLPQTKAPAADLARVLNAMPNERKQVDKAVTELLAVGFLAHENGRLWVPRFTDAQTSRSAGARRQAKYRERHNGAVDSNVTSNAADTSLVTSQIEENRRDETATAAAGVTGPMPCPADLALSEQQIGTLETSLIPRWAIPILTARFIAKHQADQADKRTREVWLKCLVKAVSGDWFNTKTRPNKPEPDDNSGSTSSTEGWS